MTYQFYKIYVIKLVNIYIYIYMMTLIIENMKDLRKKKFVRFYNFILRIFLSSNKKVNITKNKIKLY